MILTLISIDIRFRLWFLPCCCWWPRCCCRQWWWRRCRRCRGFDLLSLQIPNAGRAVLWATDKDTFVSRNGQAIDSVLVAFECSDQIAFSELFHPASCVKSWLRPGRRLYAIANTSRCDSLAHAATDFLIALPKEGCRMEGTLDFGSFDLGANFKP